MSDFATIKEIDDAARFSSQNIEIYEKQGIGRSVCALKDFVVDEIICSYGGRCFESDDAPESDYVLTLNKNLVIDGNPLFPESQGHIGNYINDANGPIRCGENNARFSVGRLKTPNGVKRVVWIKAQRPIVAKTDVLIPYGKNFWQSN